MKICSKCHHPVPENQDSCPNCGSSNVEIIESNNKSKISPTNSPQIYCIKCGKEIPKNSDFCPFCGSKQEKLPETPNKKDISKNKKSPTFAWVIAIVCVFIMGYFTYSILSPGKPTTKPVKQLTSAEKIKTEENLSIYSAWEYIKSTLKDPDSAKFKEDTAGFKKIDDTEYSIVTGYVKSRNSFNANVTDPYVVIMKKGDLSLIYGNIGGNVFYSNPEGESIFNRIIAESNKKK